jgi:hypothetical protein
MFLKTVCEEMFDSASDRRKVRMLRDPLKSLQWPNRSRSFEQATIEVLKIHPPGKERHPMIDSVIRQAYGGRKPWENEPEWELRVSEMFQVLDSGMTMAQAVTEAYKRQNLRLYRCRYKKKS